MRTMLGPTYEHALSRLHSEWVAWRETHRDTPLELPTFRFGPDDVGIVGDIEFLWPKMAVDEGAKQFLQKLVSIEDEVGGITLFMLDVFFTALGYPHIQREKTAYFMGPQTQLDIPRNSH